MRDSSSQPSQRCGAHSGGRRNDPLWLVMIELSLPPEIVVAIGTLDNGFKKLDLTPGGCGTDGFLVKLGMPRAVFC